MINLRLAFLTASLFVSLDTHSPVYAADVDNDAGGLSASVPHAGPADGDPVRGLDDFKARVLRAAGASDDEVAALKDVAKKFADLRDNAVVHFNQTAKYFKAAAPAAFADLFSALRDATSASAAATISASAAATISASAAATISASVAVTALEAAAVASARLACDFRNVAYTLSLKLGSDVERETFLRDAHERICTAAEIAVAAENASIEKSRDAAQAFRKLVADKNLKG